MDLVVKVLDAARDAIKRRDWVAARDSFRAAREQGQALSADDAYAASDAAWCLGLVDEYLQVAQEAFDLYLAEARPRPAAVTALGIAYTQSLRGDQSIASACMSRGLRLLQDEPENVEHGFLVYLDLEAALAAADFEAAIEQARHCAAMGQRFGNPNLVALGLLGEGRALVKQGRVSDGMRLLDEAMLAALSDKLDPSWAGNIYCNLMLACYELMDHRRAGEWTQATARWCESMPGAGPFMGICRVHRCQVLQVRGAWDEAEREVRRVCADLAHFHVSIVAEAYYHLGDLRRLRGDLPGAENALRQAHQLGREPQPGLALLRLAQGRIDSALASIQVALAAEAAQDRLARARLCVALVDIALAAGDVELAASASAELDETASLYASSGLEATALHAHGAVLLARGDAAQALPVLRAALAGWQTVQAMYDIACVRLLLASTLELLGDHDAALLELDAAEAAFGRLGATAQVRKLQAGRASPPLPAGLTRRECEVLALAASGLSNGDIAERLVLSVRTVERHLATVYQKLGLQGRSARAAAVGFALREGLATT